MQMLCGKWTGAGSVIASLLFAWTMARQIFPHELRTYAKRYIAAKLLCNFYPYVEITFPEYVGERFRRNEAYTAIDRYLTATCRERAKLLKAEMGRDAADLVFSMDEHEEVAENFQGVRVEWCTRKSYAKRQTFSKRVESGDDRFYRLIFHRSQRRLVTESYLRHVMERGKALKLQQRQLRLYTNSSRYVDDYGKVQWSHVSFQHPATFDTVAMDPDKKLAIIQDLLAFAKSKDYYHKVGKPWKRGYLLYGPPGTGKSTVIAAMANLMRYDVYDLELTAIKDNMHLRRLFIETSSKSILVIEDIDCSLNLSGKRKSKQAEGRSKAETKRCDKEETKVTLSGLLNFIDGLWSTSGSQRLIVFTTNFVEKLDPALIRRGRMDMHIELSYCTFGAFKLLAKNYLGVEEHESFDEIKGLMEKNDITPADVAEILMPKTLIGITDHQIEVCLGNLIQALKGCQPKGEAKNEAEEPANEVTNKQNAEAAKEAANGETNKRNAEETKEVTNEETNQQNTEETKETAGGETNKQNVEETKEATDEEINKQNADEKISSVESKS